MSKFTGFEVRFESVIEADVAGDSNIPFCMAYCPWRLGDELMVHAATGITKRAHHCRFPDHEVLQGNLLWSWAQRRKYTRKKKEKTKSGVKAHLISCISSSRPHWCAPVFVYPMSASSHMAFYMPIFTLFLLLSRTFPSLPLSDLCNLKSWLGADIMTRPDFKINLPLDTGLFYWVHQGWKQPHSS